MKMVFLLTKIILSGMFCSNLAFKEPPLIILSNTKKIFVYWRNITITSYCTTAYCCISLITTSNNYYIWLSLKIKDRKQDTSFHSWEFILDILEKIGFGE